ncbi:MAG: beta strand repeat-containing protein, partial [Planctomyces sp.]
TDTVKLAGSPSDVTVDILTIGAASLSAFVGVNGGTANAKGLALTGVEFGLAIAARRSDKSKKYTALKASATGASVTGIPGFSLTSSNLAVAINRPDSDGTLMNLAADPLPVASAPGRAITLDFDSAAGVLVEASGTMNISVESFFNISGNFALRRATDTLKDNTGNNVDVDLLTLGAEDVTAFAGINAGTARPVGLSLAHAGFALAIATSRTNPALTWRALVADAGSAAFTGPSELEIAASSVSIAVNRPAADGSLIDFSADPLVIATGPTTTRTLTFSSADGAITEASGNLRINLSNFVQFSGNLALRKSTATLKLSTGADVTTELLAIGGTDLTAFAGINGGSPDAMGFSLSGLNFAFATATDVSDRTRTWMALDAVATGIAFNGLPGVSIAASSLDLALNRPASDSTLINFAAQPLTLKTGPASTRTLDLTGTAGPLLEASGNLTIDVAGFFRVSGALGVKKSEFDLALSSSDTTTQRVNLLTVAGDNLSAFAGMNAASPDRTGLSLSNLNFALALASDKADPDRRWTTLQATAGAVAVTGISGVTMSSSNLAVTINRKAADDTLANYSRTPLTLSTGAGTKTIDLNSNVGPLVEASGTLNIAVQNFFTVNGGFAVRSARDTVTLSNATTVDADLLTIGGDNVSAFAGLNGGSATQTGISLGNADFGLAFITDRRDATRKFTSLQATAGLAAFVGADTINITGTDLSVAINRGLHNNFPAIPGASANSQYRLTIDPQTLGSLTFNKDTSSASANILSSDSDAQVAAKVRTALEGLTAIGAGNVTVTGSRDAGFTVEFINALARTSVTGLTVSTNATMAGSLAATQSAASVTGISAVQSITLTRLPVERPTVSTSVSEVAAGFAGTGQITAIRVAAAATASGQYTLTYNGQSRTIRWAQNNVDMNATRIGDALRDLTGDSFAKVRFDQQSFITNQRFIVKFTNAPGTITGSTTTLSGTVTIETERAAAGAVNEQQAITLNVGSATGTFRVSIPWNGRTYTTTTLPLTASTADLQTAINNAVSETTGTVSVTKNTDGTAVT